MEPRALPTPPPPSHAILPRAVPLLCLLLAPAASLAQEHHVSPYVHDRSDEVKTLSTTEVDELLSGAGMGLARPAELNGYPGPKHVLELAHALELTPEQRTATEDAFRAVSEEATALGREIVEAEKTLDRLFAASVPSDAEVAEAVEAVGELRSALRVVHLKAHLRMKGLLTREQVEAYERLRGYGGHGG